MSTNIAEIERLVANYQVWLKDRTNLKCVHEDWVEITTPFLDRHNDAIQIYAKREGNSYRLTDDGFTLRDLETSGCSLDTPKRRQLLMVALNGFGVEQVNAVLSVKANAENFSARKHALIQSILAVNDLFYTASPSVRSLFKEDVEKWLDLSEIRYIPNVQFSGKSGYQHQFDFAIPKSKQAPERIIKAINNPNKDAALSFIMAWHDTVEQRPADSTAVAFLNDNDRIIASAVRDAFNQYDITAVLWSDRARARVQLAA